MAQNTHLAVLVLMAHNSDFVYLHITHWNDFLSQTDSQRWYDHVRLQYQVESCQTALKITHHNITVEPLLTATPEQQPPAI